MIKTESNKTRLSLPWLAVGILAVMLILPAHAWAWVIADAGPDQEASVGQLVQLEGSATDSADGTDFFYGWIFSSKPEGSIAVFSDYKAQNPTFIPDLPGHYEARFDAFSGTTFELGFDSVIIHVPENLNQAPSAIITSPSSGMIMAVNELNFFEAEISDPDEGDTHTATWTISGDNLIEDIVLEGTVVGSLVSDELDFLDAGIYSISLTVTDEAGESATANTVNDDPDMPSFIVVYNPDGGFVTGGGWIYSPAGALDSDPTLEGKASFGFVAKYKHGATTPTGNTEFKFKAGDFRFKSASYEWLVVAGKKAMFKGEGSVDDMDGSFRFMLTAVDDTDDKFRIKIWDHQGVIYDNKMGQGDDADATVIGGGSIAIHKK